MEISIDILEKLVLAMVLGGLIGAEREYRSKSAGFRTLMMISVGAALFTMLSMVIGKTSSPERIASNVVVGIGFVGAGVIFKGDDTRVNGITTAATIWVTAAIGVAIGAGQEVMATLGCLTVLVILFLFNGVESWIDRKNQLRIYKIVCSFENKTLQRFEDIFKQFHLKHKEGKQVKSGNTIKGEWVVQGSAENHEQCIASILMDPTVSDFEF